MFSFRNDRHPTVGFAYNDKHKLKIRDFAGYGMWGDCFDVVAYVLSFTTGRQINVSVKADFIMFSNILLILSVILYITVK